MNHSTINKHLQRYGIRMPQILGAVGHIGEEWADGFRLSGIETGCQKIPIVLATAMWGRQCSHKHVLIKFIVIIWQQCQSWPQRQAKSRV